MFHPAIPPKKKGRNPLSVCAAQEHTDQNLPGKKTVQKLSMKMLTTVVLSQILVMFKALVFGNM